MNLRVRHNHLVTFGLPTATTHVQFNNWTHVLGLSDLLALPTILTTLAVETCKRVVTQLTKMVWLEQVIIGANCCRWSISCCFDWYVIEFHLLWIMCIYVVVYARGFMYWSYRIWLPDKDDYKNMTYRIDSSYLITTLII